MKRVLTILLICTLCLAFATALAACGETPVQEPHSQEEETVKGNPIVQFSFHTGDVITVELYPDAAPITVANFLQYVNEGFYTGTVIHRVGTSVVQGGGYVYRNGRYEERTATHAAITGEFSDNGVTNNVSHTAGAISMARTTVFNSATSQFFFCPYDHTGWDGQYAAFGHVVDEDSLAAIRRLSNVEHSVSTDGTGTPYEPIIVRSVKVIG